MAAFQHVPQHRNTIMEELVGSVLPHAFTAKAAARALAAVPDSQPSIHIVTLLVLQMLQVRMCSLCACCQCASCGPQCSETRLNQNIQLITWSYLTGFGGTASNGYCS